MHRVLETSEPGNDRDRNGNGKKVALMASLARSPHRATTDDDNEDELAGCHGATAEVRKDGVDDATAVLSSAKPRHAA